MPPIASDQLPLRPQAQWDALDIAQHKWVTEVLPTFPNLREQYMGAGLGVRYQYFSKAAGEWLWCDEAVGSDEDSKDCRVDLKSLQTTSPYEAASTLSFSVNDYPEAAEVGNINARIAALANGQRFPDLSAELYVAPNERQLLLDLYRQGKLHVDTGGWVERMAAGGALSTLPPAPAGRRTPPRRSARGGDQPTRGATRRGITVPSPVGIDPSGIPDDQGSVPPDQSPDESPDNQSPDASQCQNDLCGCMDRAMGPIGDSLATIADKFGEALNFTCDKLDGCEDKIVEMLKRRLEGPLYTCSECQNLVANGAGGTLEYAVRCAAVKCDETPTEPDGHPDGGECRLPDGTTGRYYHGECVPEDYVPPTDEPPTPPEPQVGFIGYCNYTLGVVLVQPANEPPPAGYVQVASGKDEAAVAAETTHNCEQKINYRPPSQGSFPPAQFGTNACNLSNYASSTALAQNQMGASSAHFADAVAKNLERAYNQGIGPITFGNIFDLVFNIGRTAFTCPPAANILLTPHIVEALQCTHPAFANSINVLSSFGAIQKAIGTDLSEYLTQYHYAANIACRRKFLEPAPALQAYLGHAFEYRELDTLFGMHGLCNDATNWSIQANKSKPNPHQLSMLRRRSLVSPSEYNEGMRQLGYLEPSTHEKLHVLTENLPGLSDIMRLMVRDAGDERIEFWRESDRIFGTKYTSTLKKWADWQGVPPEFAKLAWRAHWTIPAPGQLFEFYHRLRNLPEFGPPDELLQRIKDALSQQDILPFWQDYYLAVSFRPLGRIDIRRSYEIGTLPDSELVPSFTQLGYSDEVSEKLAKYTRRLRDNAIVGSRPVKQWIALKIDKSETTRRLLAIGYPQESIDKALLDAENTFDASPIIRSFARGLIAKAEVKGRLTEHGLSAEAIDRTLVRVGILRSSHFAVDEYATGIVERSKAQQLMESDGLDSSVVSNLLTIVDSKIRVKRAVNCQHGVKRRYLLGEFDDIEAQNALEEHGTEHSAAIEIFRSWQCEKSALGKAVPTSKLCGWLERGVITAPDMAKRLIKMGYKEPDAMQIVNDCMVSINAKQLKAAEKSAKDQLARDRKNDSDRKKAEAEILRKRVQAERARKAAETARKGREKQLLTAVEKMTDKCDCSLYDCSSYAKDTLNILDNSYGLSIDESLQVLIKAVEEWEGGDLSSLTPIVDAFAELAGLPTLEFSGNGAELIGSTNGSTHPPNIT